MTNLEKKFDKEAFITFPDYNLNLAAHASNSWEKLQPETFKIDLIAVSQNRQFIFVIFNVEDNTFFKSKTISIFHVVKFKKFILTSLWKELKTCGLASGLTKIKLGLNYTGLDEILLNKTRSFCMKEDYHFWEDLEYIEVEEKIAS